MAVKLILALVLFFTYSVWLCAEGGPIKLQFNDVTVNFNESTSAQFQDCLLNSAGCFCEMKSDNFMFNASNTNAGGTKAHCNRTTESSRKVCTFNILFNGITLRYVYIVCQPTFDDCISSDSESSRCWPVCWTGSLNILLTNSPYGNCFLKYKISLNQTNKTEATNGYTLTSSSNHARTTESLLYVQHTTLTESNFLSSLKYIYFITYSSATQSTELKTSNALHPSISSTFISSTKNTLMSNIHQTTPTDTPTLSELSIIFIGLSTVSISNVVYRNTEFTHKEQSLLSTHSLVTVLNRSAIVSTILFGSSIYLSSGVGLFQTWVPVAYTDTSSATVALVLNMESNYKSNNSSTTLYDQAAHAYDNNTIVIILSVTLSVLSVAFTFTIIVFLIKRKRRPNTLAVSKKTKDLKTGSQMSSNRTQRNHYLQSAVEIKSSYDESIQPDIISCSRLKKASTEPERKEEAATNDSVGYDYIDDSKSNDYGPLDSKSNSNTKSKVIIKPGTVNPYLVVNLALTQNESWTTNNRKPSSSVQLENKYFVLLDKDASQNGSDSNSELSAVSNGSKRNSNSECETVSTDSSFYYMENKQQNARNGKNKENIMNTKVDNQFPYSRLNDINRSFEHMNTYNKNLKC